MGRDIVVATPAGPVAAWRADPPHKAAAKGAIVVIQEIFGVNAHIRSIADGYAAAGYAAIAPALFDPVARNVELRYDSDGFAEGRRLAGELGLDAATGILRATRALLRQDGHRQIAAVGVCWGGFLTIAVRKFPELREFLGIKEDERVCGAQMFGWPAVRPARQFPPRKLDITRV